MHLAWSIEQSDNDRLKDFISSQENNLLVRDRINRNLAQHKNKIDRPYFWRQMVSLRMTSVQRYGPNSHVAAFLRQNPFPLEYNKVRAINIRDKLPNVISEILRAHGGIRFADKIAYDLTENYYCLEAESCWETTLSKLNELIEPPDAKKEREVARYIQGLLRGIGPKQSRNYCRL